MAKNNMTAVEWADRKIRAYRVGYRQKYYDYFINKYHFDALTSDENEFIFDSFWYKGKVCTFKYGRNKEVSPLVFADFARAATSRYGKDAAVSPIAQWSADPYPTNLAVDKDATICYIRADHFSIWSLVEPMIEDIVDAEMVLKIHEVFLKLPLFFKSTPENEEKMAHILKNLLKGIPCMNITGSELDSIEALNEKVEFHLPELVNHITERENKLKNFFGIDNTPQEDYSRLNVDQTNANNAELNSSNDMMFNRIKEWAERTKEYLRVDMKPVERIKPVTSFHDDVRGGKDNEDEED